MFKLTEWWTRSITINDENVFVRTGAIEGACYGQEPFSDIVCVASSTGTIRVFHPIASSDSADPLIELNLGFEILQIELGNFIAAIDQPCLAVLLLDKLLIFAFSTDINGILGLNRIAECKLEHCAFNFCFGRFGRCPGRDMICVQTIDGYLLIVDGGSVLCVRKLDTFVFPGPLAYIAHTDSIVIFSSDLLLECYSVRDLITMGSVRALTTENPVSISKVDLNTLGTSWSLQLGDVVKGVLSGRFLDSADMHAVDIVIIGHQTIIVVSGYGEIKQTIPMEFIPHHWFPFLNKTEKIHTLLVVSKSGLFTIYKNLMSIWTIDCNEAQKAVAVGTFGQNTGMIVHLTKCGSLKISAIALWPFAFSFSNGLRAVNQNFKERNKVIKIDSSVSTQQFNVDMVFSKSQAAINYFTADQQKAIVSAQGLPFIVDVSIHQLHSCADDPYLVSIETPPCFLLSQTMFLIGYSEPQFKFAIVLASVLVPSLELCLTIHSKQAFALESHKFDIPLDICGCYSISSRIDNLKHSVLLHQLYKENNENKFAKFQFHWKASKNLSPLLSATVYKVLHSQFESFGHSGKIPKMLAPGSASKYSFSEEHLATTQELLQVSKQKIAYKIKTYQAIQGTLLHHSNSKKFLPLLCLDHLLKECSKQLLCIINEHQQLYMAYIDILSGLATTKSLNDLKGLTIVC